MRTCNRCHQPKDESEFNKRSSRKDGLQPFCRSCQHKQFRRYYADNKTSHREQVQLRRERQTAENREYIIEYLQSHSCVDCPCKDVRVLEFDHLDADKKHRGVMVLAQNGSGLDAVKREIDKCEVRCRNCHTIKTYERMGGTWHDHFMEANPQ